MSQGRLSRRRRPLHPLVDVEEIPSQRQRHQIRHLHLDFGCQRTETGQDARDPGRGEPGRRDEPYACRAAAVGAVPQAGQAEGLLSSVWGLTGARRVGGPDRRSRRRLEEETDFVVSSVCSFRIERAPMHVIPHHLCALSRLGQPDLALSLCPSFARRHSREPSFWRFLSTLATLSLRLVVQTFSRLVRSHPVNRAIAGSRPAPSPAHLPVRLRPGTSSRHGHLHPLFEARQATQVQVQLDRPVSHVGASPSPATEEGDRLWADEGRRNVGESRGGAVWQNEQRY